jgi:hypothetical protein
MMVDLLGRALLIVTMCMSRNESGARQLTRSFSPSPRMPPIPAMYAAILQSNPLSTWEQLRVAILGLVMVVLLLYLYSVLRRSSRCPSSGSTC